MVDLRFSCLKNVLSVCGWYSDVLRWYSGPVLCSCLEFFEFHLQLVSFCHNSLPTQIWVCVVSGWFVLFIHAHISHRWVSKAFIISWTSQGQSTQHTVYIFSKSITNPDTKFKSCVYSRNAWQVTSLLPCSARISKGELIVFPSCFSRCFC